MKHEGGRTCIKPLSTRLTDVPRSLRAPLRAPATCINDAMKIAAARTIADNTAEGDLIPNILLRDAHTDFARSVETAAQKTGF